MGIINFSNQCQKSFWKNFPGKPRLNIEPLVKKSNAIIEKLSPNKIKTVIDDVYKFIEITEDKESPDDSNAINLANEICKKLGLPADAKDEDAYKLLYRVQDNIIRIYRENNSDEPWSVEIHTGDSSHADSYHIIKVKVIANNREDAKKKALDQVKDKYPKAKAVGAAITDY